MDWINTGLDWLVRNLVKVHTLRSHGNAIVIDLLWHQPLFHHTKVWCHFRGAFYHEPNRSSRRSPYAEIRLLNLGGTLLANNNHRQFDSLLRCNSHELGHQTSIQASKAFMSDNFFETIEAVAVHQLPDVGPRALVLHPVGTKMVLNWCPFSNAAQG